MKTILLAGIAGFLILTAHATTANSASAAKETLLLPQSMDATEFSSARIVRRSRAVGRRGAIARRSSVYVGPRGRVVTRRATVVRPGWRGAGVRRAAVVRPGWNGAGTRWVRPANYWWRPGAAVAAGAAIGFVTASAAATAAYASTAAPGPNYCWYYTDANRTVGFWDQCPN